VQDPTLTDLDQRCLCRSSRDERGPGFPAELAIAIPALILVVGLVMRAIRWSMDALFRDIGRFPRPLENRSRRTGTIELGGIGS